MGEKYCLFYAYLATISFSISIIIVEPSQIIPTLSFHNDDCQQVTDHHSHLSQMKLLQITVPSAKKQVN